MSKREKSFPAFLFKKLRRKFPVGTTFFLYDYQIESYIKEILFRHDPKIILHSREAKEGLEVTHTFTIDGRRYYYCVSLEKRLLSEVRLLGITVFTKMAGDAQLTLLNRPYSKDTSSWRRVATLWEDFFFLSHFQGAQ